MLPPFVPLWARSSSETLPPITEFVLGRVERSFGDTVETLPTIDEFVVELTPDKARPQTTHDDSVGPIATRAEPPHSSQLPSEIWVTEERDAFDWQGVASLGAPARGEKRAAAEWSSTKWEPESGPVQVRIAALLAQVSRRVRSGELEVRGSKQMGAEAALVAAVGALLAESVKK